MCVKVRARVPRTFMAPYSCVTLLITSHTVEKWPQPSLVSTVYRPLLYRSPT